MYSEAELGKILKQEPMSKVMQLPHEAYVTAFL